MFNLFSVGGAGNRLKLSGKEYLLYIGVGLAFIGLIILYVFEFKYFHATFGMRRLMLLSLLAGVALGAFLAYRLRGKAADLTETIQQYVACIILTAVFMPLLFSLANRYLSFQPLRWEAVEFFEEKAFASSRLGFMEGEKIQPDGYYLFFFRHGVLERVRTKHPFPGSPDRGDTIEIPVKKGLLGFSWVVVNEIN